MYKSMWAGGFRTAALRECADDRKQQASFSAGQGEGVRRVLPGEMVPRTGVEPVHLAAAHFKCDVSTNFTIEAVQQTAD